MSDTLAVTCPCCATKLVLDRASGEILSEERPKVDATVSFEKALNEVQTGSRRREDAFSKAFERTKNLDDVLSKKFEEARKKAAEDKSPYRNPLDND